MSEHEIFRSNTASSSLTFSGGELRVRETGFSRGAGIRVLDDRRIGFAFCEDESLIRETIGKAEGSARFSTPSGFSFPGQSRIRRCRASDPKLDPSDTEALKDLVDSLVASSSASGARVKASVTLRRGDISIENTNGLDRAYKKTAYSAYVEAMDGDGFGFAYSSGTNIPKDLSRIGGQAAKIAKEMRGSLKIPGGDYTVVIRPEAMDGLLDVLLPSLSGDWKRRGISRLSEGQALFDPRFSLSEDGLAEGAGIRPFDDEGVPSRRRPLIEGGIVSSFMHDRECAALAGVDEDGFCERNGFDSPPGIGPSNLVIDRGDRKDMSDLGRYLEVYSMHGSHTANATSGDAGFEVSTAFLVEDSHRTPVRGLMMSCNVFDMFRTIECIGSEQHTLGSLTCPLIAFKGVRIVS